jgi:2-polyprenyl-3-methyl-5-hydroxy-6-metoxy-1,4-benzoquinol methylase
VSEYIYDASLEDEHTRLHALEAVLDPGSIRIFETIGIERSWRCLEVGGGGGSIAHWLSQHAAHVVATDLDTRYLERVPASNLEIRKHDAAKDPFESGAYDLVHSRDVLEHIPEREAVLDKMVDAMKPGGWLVAEDVDFTAALRADGFGEQNDVITLDGRWYATGTEAMKKLGIDPEYGRKLPWRLKARGLTDISGDVRAVLFNGGTLQTKLYEHSLSQQRKLLEAFMSADELDRLAAHLKSEDYMAFGPIHVAAWGRKPA